MNRAEEAVANRFTILLQRITAGPLDGGPLRVHARSVRARLKQGLDVDRVEAIGSYARNTAVRSASDLDLMAVLRTKQVTWGGTLKTSTAVLNTLKRELESRFWATDISRDGQAVVVSFGAGAEAVDVVPAFYHRPLSNGYPVFKIPDGAGDWRETAPQFQGKFLWEASARSGGKLSATARLLKWLAAARTATQALRGFHIEMLLASEDICKVGMGYADCVSDALACLHRRGCRALQDPTGISGLIPAASTPSQVQALAASVSSIANRCGAAIEAAWRMNTAEAIRQWRIVFGTVFPS